jgi:hypothetical protein
MGEIHIHGNVENSIIIQGDHNTVTVSLGAGLTAERRETLTRGYLEALVDAWGHLVVTVQGEERHLPLERVFFMLQVRERPEAKPPS